MASSLEPAVVGLGLTSMSLSAGGVPVDLAIEAVAGALADAGLTARDVDGLLVNSSQGVRPDRLGVALARQGGLGDLRLLEHVEIKGATAVAMIQRAVLAIRAGLASTVVCVFADAPLRAGGTSGSTYAHSGGSDGARGLERASGVLGSVPTYALLASRYFAVSGGDPEDLCAVAVSTRAWALGNPDAVVRKPLDAEGYFASRMISTPLRVLDCARPVNGAVALVVSGEATPGPAPRIHVRGMGQAHPMRRRRAPGESWFGGGRAAVDGALAMAGLTRADLDVVELYDPFSVVTLLLLEEYGLVEPGQAGKVVRSGATAPGGDLPVNTGGGQLSGFYLQGMTPLAEAVVQLRGTGGARQVPGASTALVGGIGGRGDHHACLILDLEPSR
ncbi:thiolase family protein [Frankia sp. QA3]|uniref:thiolase family protein n=1 Tax=Frankia sp. QA3 TaxID=710111 RepID=UPI000269BDC2|nr:acetyl-CoA acetyltransferase [Frankia sp. QA3]